MAFLVSFILQVLSNPFRPVSAHVNDLWFTHGPFLLVMLFLLPVFVMDTVKLSHRFAGPICSLRRAIREVAAGETPRRLKFRRKDFWKDLADDYNAMLARLGAFDETKPEATLEKQLGRVEQLVTWRNAVFPFLRSTTETQRSQKSKKTKEKQKYTSNFSF